MPQHRPFAGGLQTVSCCRTSSGVVSLGPTVRSHDVAAIFSVPLEQTRTAEQPASSTAADATFRVVAAEARADTLQKAHNALLQRVVPEAPGSE